MKKSNFTWQWNNGPVIADTVMTRARAAMMLAVPVSSRLPANYSNAVKLKWIKPGQYFVHSFHGESTIMTIGSNHAR